MDVVPICARWNVSAYMGGQNPLLIEDKLVIRLVCLFLSESVKVVQSCTAFFFYGLRCSVS